MYSNLHTNLAQGKDIQTYTSTFVFCNEYGTDSNVEEGNINLYNIWFSGDVTGLDIDTFRGVCYV